MSSSLLLFSFVSSFSSCTTPPTVCSVSVHRQQRQHLRPPPMTTINPCIISLTHVQRFCPPTAPLTLVQCLRPLHLDPPTTPLTLIQRLRPPHFYPPCLCRPYLLFFSFFFSFSFNFKRTLNVVLTS
jgi:hypothetical protein